MPPLKHDRLQVAAAGEDDERSPRPPHGEAEVAEEERERGEERGDPDEAARRQTLEEDPLVAHLAEPEPFGVQLRHRWQHHEERQEYERERQSGTHRTSKVT